MNSIVSYFKSFGYAIEGLVHAFNKHSSFKIESIAAVLVLLVGVYFRITRIEWMVLFLLIFSILVAELLNTAVETSLDYFAKEHHIDVKIAKDVAAGAVFLLSIGSVVIGTIMFFPYFVTLF